MMRRIPALAFGVSLGIASAAFGADFDGKHELVCSAGEAAECDTSALCEKVAAGDIDLPGELHVDFKKKLVRSADGQRSSPIHAVEASDAALIVQGSQNGRGWSMVIERASGKLTGTIAEVEGAIVLSGSCANAP